MVDNTRRIFESDPAGGLSRGFFVWNSEVGSSAFGIMTFLYAYVCGNHLVWGAKGVRELRIRHIGNADGRAFGELEGELRKYSDDSAGEDEARIEATRRLVLGAKKEEVLDAIFKLGVPALSRDRLDKAYVLAETHRDLASDPNTAWGMAQGLTRLSQTLPYTDDRVALDRAAGRVLEMAF